MLSHQEPSHPRYTSCQLKGCISVINYIRSLVRTFDWLLAKGHLRTSTTKDRYKCDLKNKLQSPKPKKWPVIFRARKMWQFRTGFANQMIRHHYVSVTVVRENKQTNKNLFFTTETDNSLCYLTIISRDLRAHHVPTIASVPRQSVSVQVTPTPERAKRSRDRRECLPASSYGFFLYLSDSFFNSFWFSFESWFLFSLWRLW